MCEVDHSEWCIKNYLTTSSFLRHKQVLVCIDAEIDIVRVYRIL